MKRLGATIMEVTIAALVLGIVVMGFASFQIATVKQNQRERDRAFAMQKCVQIMEELKIKVAGNANTLLDDYGQGDTTYSYSLAADNINPYSGPLSDNIQEGAGYRFVRQIWVRPLPRDKGARQVTVRVFRSTAKATPGVKAGAVPLATLANIFKSTPNIVVPTQQFDLYSIGVAENTLGKMDYCAYPWATANEDYMKSAMNYLASATSGLSMVVKPIRLTSYGRDTYYSPLHNDHEYWTWYYDKTAGATLSNPNTVPLNHVYFRPGMNEWWHVLSLGQGQSTYWRAPDTIPEAETPSRYPILHGNTAGHLYDVQPAYSYADQNNHSLRYHEVQEKQRVRGNSAVLNNYLGSGVNYGSYRWSPDNYELTLRGLLDDMIAGKRKNAILLNMHGEVFPMIPMRNYSDAAKVPAHTDMAALKDNWGVSATDANTAKAGAAARLVTHPRTLEYDKDDVVELRVFPHFSDPDSVKAGVNPEAVYRNGMIVLRGMRDHLASWNGGTAADNIEVQACLPIDGQVPGSGSEEQQFWMFNDFDWDDFLKGKAKVDPGVYTTGFLFSFKAHLEAYRWVRAWPASGTLRAFDGPTPTKGKAKGKGKGLPIPYWSTAKDTFIQSVTVQTGADPANGLLDGDVIIKLKQIPFTATQFNGEQNGAECAYGLDKNYTLHGMNYFPDPLLPDMTDGYKRGEKMPRNSARFRILFKTNKPKEVEVLTTIGDDPNLLHHQAPNRSRTWAWVGVPAPETERYQLIGDPRHNPYDDVRDEKRYNRYFADLDDAYFTEDGDTDYNKFDDTADGWGPNNSSKGRLDFDAPRYFELWRQALLNTNSMLATPTADSFRVIALGGEYGAYNEAQGGRITHSKQPMTGEKNKAAQYDEWRNPTLVANKDKKWHTKPWLGELYPDDQWDNWYTKGNLPSDEFRRLEYQDIDSFKAAFTVPVFKRTKYVDEWGPMGFYNATTQFAFKSASGNAKIVGAGLPNPTDGKAVSADLKALLRETYHSYKSFSWDSGATRPPGLDEFGRTTLISGLDGSSNDAYYKATDDQKSVAPFVMRRDGKTAYHLAFTPWNAWSGANDPYSMMRVFAGTVLQGYLDMASPSYDGGGSKGTNRIRLLPRINITKPEDDALATGTTLRIEWTPEWTRWDGKPYSRLYGSYGSDGDEPTLHYIVKYSEDGKNWRYANGTAAGVSAGGMAGSTARYVKDYATENPYMDLNTTNFKNKQYQVRIEAWRVDPDVTKRSIYNNSYNVGTYDSVHHSYAQFSVNFTK